MAGKSEPDLGVNSWFEDELYQQYLHDRGAVDETWKRVFESTAGNGVQSAAASAPGTAVRIPAIEPGPGEELVPLRGAAARIAENMAISLSIPVATSQRTIPVKVIDENRRLINHHRALRGKSKVSYTHIIGWALVKALDSFPALNNAYTERDGQAFRLVRHNVNLGIAVDVEGKEGARNLMVPTLKNAGGMDFAQFLAAFDDLVARARTGRLTLPDFQGTTISLTNPGTVGTVGSIPRLMAGQGAIIATGAIDYPAEYQGVAPEVRARLGISKVMTVTCTYDHRVIQGAESGLFLGKLQALLEGKEDFYEAIFSHLEMPHRPVRWAPDRYAALPGFGGAPSPEVAKEAAVLQLINAYRVRGHLIAALNPLGSEPSYHPELDPATYGLTIWDLDREFLTGSLGDAIREGGPQPVASLREILETLRRAYCGSVGCEYMNIQHPEQKRWIQQQMEPDAGQTPLDSVEQLTILEHLVEAEELEHFLHARFVGHKRFSLEGAETAVAIINGLLDHAAARGVTETVIGMAHRGRVNILATIIGKELVQIFSEFEGDIDPESIQGSGDVKYHLGASGVHRSPSGQEVNVSVAPNPSHLEAVDPVVEGIVRPRQDRLGDTERERVIPILVHGDAAFAGQGVVAETLNLSQLTGYRTGGTIHLIINNQIGFTTNPDEARSTPYSTDVARGVQAPIFHVNGDDPEAALRVTKIAFEFRQQFHKDVVIDMVCYRRHGHNEADDPSYTQPILYRQIRQHPSVAAIYSEQLVRQRAIGSADVSAMRRRVTTRLNEAYEAAQKHAERFEVQELSIVSKEQMAPPPHAETAADPQILRRVVESLTTFPSEFHVHPKLRQFIERRRESFEKGGPIDWALGESLAFGSLAFEGTPVRLSGQDSARGTFSQRHLELFDSEDGHQYVPLKHVSPQQARFDVYDSLLSEYAVLGFEFGYSLADPLTLVIWEAQFGDFANGGQIMIDQFIASAESKWGQPSGLVMLLPHGYEGQGPEHSSARIERFLTLCAEQNLQVANCTTPAQYFHLLRRQMFGGPDRRGVRKPLVIFTPKSLLRHPKAVSRLEEFTGGGFGEVLDDAALAGSGAVRRLVFCSGKIYYDLLAARDQRGGPADVALIRMEQLYPFPQRQVNDLLLGYPSTAEVVWAQEEPRNMGAWRFMWEQMQPLLNATRREVRYIGRAESASPAAGSLKRHQQEQTEIVEDSLAPGSAEVRRVRLVARRKR